MKNHHHHHPMRVPFLASVKLSLAPPAPTQHLKPILFFTIFLCLLNLRPGSFSKCINSGWREVIYDSILSIFFLVTLKTHKLVLLSQKISSVLNQFCQRWLTNENQPNMGRIVNAPVHIKAFDMTKLYDNERT